VSKFKEALATLRQFGSASIKLPSHPAEIAKLRFETKTKLSALIEKAQAENRDLTEQENSEFESGKELLEACSNRLESVRWDSGDNVIPIDFGGKRNGDRTRTGDMFQVPRVTPEQTEGLEAVAEWMRNGVVVASDTPLHGYTSPISPGASTAIETHVLDAIATYYRNDAFQRAGATIYQTPDTTPLIKPIISAGDDPEEFQEGQSATESAPMDVRAFTFGGAKYSRLVKVSEELLMNSALNLPSEILSELAASVANKFTSATTQALVDALHSNSSCFVSQGSDKYETLLSLRSAVPQRFEDPTNVWMMSRHDLQLVRNTRDLQDRPLFDPDSGTIFGFRVVINDNLSRVVFGNWAAGAYVRKSPFVLQRLIELYSSEGHMGFKATQFLDSKFLASVSAVEVQPLFYTSLDTAGS
jgi:HK97 family phage major capsid protein